MNSWALITGEYPPAPGGVSDYSRQIATGLEAAGDRVEVFAPFAHGPDPRDGLVAVHRLAGGFSPLGLLRLSSAIDRLPSPRRILVQWVPQAFGFRGMNLPFCAWLRRRHDPVDLMFHEVASPGGRGRPLKHRFLAAAQRRMAAIAISSADRVFVSTSSWEPTLRDLGLAVTPVLLPIPSNLPTSIDRGSVAEIGVSVGQSGNRLLVGHFGTFRGLVADLLSELLRPLLVPFPNRLAILVGRGSREFSRTVTARTPGLRGRLLATGELSPEEAAAHLAACDVLVQPFPDGVTTRRTSFMAGLALGVPAVTNSGHLTEPFWMQSGATVVASSPQEIVTEVARLLADPDRLRRIRARGAELYRERFALERTTEKLRAGI